MRKIVFSFHYAWFGVYYAFKYNRNLWIDSFLAILTIIFGFIFRINSLEVVVVAVMITLVICAEMINTAIEEVVNLLVNEHRKEAKIAKDVSAGMVLVTAIMAFVVGLIIFLPHIFH